MAHNFHLLLPDDQYSVLDREANRSSISIAELIRRAIDNSYGTAGDRKVFSIIHTLGRRPGRRIG